MFDRSQRSARLTGIGEDMFMLANLCHSRKFS